MTSKEITVVIVGGGIGGLVCALSIAQHCPGIKIDLYEQAPEIKEIGAGIGIGVNAAKIIHRLGLGEEGNAISGKRNNVHRTCVRFDNGGEIVTVKADDVSDIRQMSVHRAEFLELLFNAVKSRGIAGLHTNRRCVGVEDKGDLVKVLFSDGSSTTANLVIGADGIHSVVRSQFAEDKPRYSGRICYRGLVPMEKAEQFWPFDTFAVSWLGKDKHFLVFPISQNKTVNIVAFVTKSLEELGDLKESWTSTAPRSELAAEFEKWDPTLRKLINCMEERPGKWLLNDRDPLDQWVFLDGKVVLLGDAAHAMLPHQGSGAGQAIEDGYILGRALQDYFKGSPCKGLQTASFADYMQAYQDVRLPRAQKAQRTSRQAGNVYEMQGDDFKDRSFEECLPDVAAQLRDRMVWMWGGNIDKEYEDVMKA